MRDKPYLKTGWSFLPQITNDGNRLEDLTYENSILESLKVLFSTLPGERIAHPLYGCDLLQYMFRPINNSLISKMENTIQTAVTLFETRIDLEEVLIKENENINYQLDIELTYMLRQTSSRYNVTIPFYTMEEQAD